MAPPLIVHWEDAITPGFHQGTYTNTLDRGCENTKLLD